MAVSSATSASGKGIDVPTIVAGLMEVERAPVAKIESQVAEKTVHISSLGAFKSKVAALQGALKVLESPSNFASKTTSTSDAGRVSAAATGAAATGVYTVKVAQTAAARVVAVGIAGSETATAATFSEAALSTTPNVSVNLDSLTITQGSTTFNTKALILQPDDSDFDAGDVVTFTVSGGQEQRFTITTTTASPSVVADAINLAVDTGTLKDIAATVSAGVLYITSENPLKGFSTGGLYAGTTTTTAGTASVEVAPAVLPTSFSITDFIAQFNDLNTSLQAKLIQTSEGNYRLAMMSTETGTDHDFTIENFNLDGAGSFATSVQTLVSARDAVFSVNGLAASRSSNEISDVVSGVTFKLVEPIDGGYDTTLDTSYASFASAAATLLAGASTTTTTISIRNDTSDLTTTAVTNLVSTYNDLVKFYNTETKKNASDETQRGTLNADPAVRAFMLQVKDYLAKGITLADKTSISFSSIGVSFMRDGTLSLDPADSIAGTSLASAIANGLQSRLAEGVSIGYQTGAANLSTFIKSALRETSGLEGLIAKRISEIESQQEKLQDRKQEIESRLKLVEARYYRQYAALDALLFKLNTINSALTSAIDGLVNSQKNN